MVNKNITKPWELVSLHLEPWIKTYDFYKIKESIPGLIKLLAKINTKFVNKVILKGFKNINKY